MRRDRIGETVSVKTWNVFILSFCGFRIYRRVEGPTQKREEEDQESEAVAHHGYSATERVNS